MDAYEIANALNQTYNLCDTLDNAGFGAYGLTNGEHRTRETLKLELSQFLMWVGNANGSFSDGELALVNFVLGMELDSFQMKQIITTNEPIPSNSLTLMGFLAGDKALNAANGTRGTQTTNVLIDLYNNMGQVMVAFDDNSVARAKLNKYISGMKTYVMKNL